MDINIWELRNKYATQNIVNIIQSLSIKCWKQYADNMISVCETNGNLSNGNILIISWQEGQKHMNQNFQVPPKKNTW